MNNNLKFLNNNNLDEFYNNMKLNNLSEPLINHNFNNGNIYDNYQIIDNHKNEVKLEINDNLNYNYYLKQPLLKNNFMQIFFFYIVFIYLTFCFFIKFIW